MSVPHSMSPFESLVPVRQTPASELADLARMFWPVVAWGATKHFVEPRNLIRESFLRDPDPICPAEHLDEVARVKTFHLFASAKLFRPTAAETLLQIRLLAEQLRATGVVVSAYEFVAADNIIFHEIESTATAFIASLSSYRRTTETVHMGQAVLYSCRLPADLQTREIAVGSRRFRWESAPRLG